MAADGWLAAVPRGGRVTLWLSSASSVQAIYKGTGAAVRVRQNGKDWGWGGWYDVALSGTGYRLKKALQWGLPTTALQMVEIEVITGPLELDQLLLHGSNPTLVPGTTVVSTRKLIVFGDSIAAGAISGGPHGVSSGWADQLIGWRVVNRSMPGATATCWGQREIARATAEAPASAAIVAFGVNDMGLYECAPTLADFEGALGSICQQLRRSLSGEPVYLSAILDSGALESRRAEWNGAIQETARANGCLYEDPSGEVRYPIDFSSDGLHPSLKGQTKLAHFWTKVIG